MGNTYCSHLISKTVLVSVTDIFVSPGLTFRRLPKSLIRITWTNSRSSQINCFVISRSQNNPSPRENANHYVEATKLKKKKKSGPFSPQIQKALLSPSTKLCSRSISSLIENSTDYQGCFLLLCQHCWWGGKKHTGFWALTQVFITCKEPWSSTLKKIFFFF